TALDHGYRGTTITLTVLNGYRYDGRTDSGRGAIHKNHPTGAPAGTSRRTARTIGADADRHATPALNRFRARKINTGSYFAPQGRRAVIGHHGSQRWRSNSRQDRQDDHRHDQLN